ncbi:zinc-finger domain-containing protein [Sporosarcina sp. ACRSM]|uniref:zinc-finger domain-containing protein n=1 Tax=Sporosarcina sp. ACRSM TaxID=2918216 RepID=UPI001EF4524B|nr:zinc-finger domain-containing protein [Sporosarcina sp. ACRSM]MCG7333835.1 zinc-finger domain-containing protein [Sporosarcina sp. ACRSM]
MNKTNVMNEITEILDVYCEECFVKRQLSKEKGKPGAHRFCITTCTIGEQLQFLGQELNKITK